MRRQGKAFACSLCIHFIACILAFGFMRGVTPEKKTLIIDFSIVDQQGGSLSTEPTGGTWSKSGTPGARRSTVANVVKQRVVSVKNVVGKVTPQAQQMAMTEDRVEEAIPEQARSSAITDSGIGVSGSSLNPGTAGSGTGAPQSGGGYGPAGSTSSSETGARTERPGMRYMKAHFAGIRSTIISKLSYPRLARRMGWTGTVKVSFIVNEDGGVNNVQVLSSSGFEVLDSNAVETIKRCSPYPKPPVIAEMIMPITYMLD